MHPRARFGRVFRLAAFMPLVRTARTFLASSLARRLGLSLLGLRLRGSFRKALACLDGSRIAGDVADQPILLRVCDESFMHKLRQLHIREFGEGSGELRFVRHLPGMIPTADLPQLLVLFQPLEQLPGEL